MTPEVSSCPAAAAPPRELVVRAAALRLAYGDHVVLDAVDVEMRQGEFWFLVGPNGEGKTTFLLAALGLARPAAGTIRRLGRCAAKTRVGFVPQRCDLNPSLPTTVREFVGTGFVGIRLPRGARAARLALALDRAGLGGLARRRYWSLSGGQRQRALVARALVRDPALLIVDEPTSGLDLTAEDALMRSIATLNAEQGMTVLFVTHDLALAARYASHVALFHAGRVTCGTTAAILTDEQLHRAYGCSIEAHADLLHAAAARQLRTVERTP